MDRTIVLSPNTGQQIDRWIADTATETDASLHQLHHSRRELESNIELRGRILDQLILAMNSVRGELERLTVEEVGKKPEEAAGEFDYAVSFISYCRELLSEFAFEHCDASGRRIREAAPGIAFLIAPFNDPLAGITRKIAPAIAAGAPALVKPASLGMLCGQAMRNAFEKSEAAPFVRFTSLDDPAVAEKIIADSRVGIVSFTGSTPVGAHVALAAAQGNKRAILELGGNAPFVVLADADLDTALDDLVIRKLKAAGQACSSVNRVYVESSIFGRFRDMLAERAKQTTAGPSTDDVDLGPLRTLRGAQQLENWSAQAQEKGEQLIAGNAKASGEGAPFVFPFSIVETETNSIFDHIETFGPLLSIRPFGDLDSLLSDLEHESHALVAYFYTGDPEGLWPRLKHLRFGSIGVNTTAIQGPDAPTGGFGQAGVGREGGPWGLREFLSTINMRQGA